MAAKILIVDNDLEYIEATAAVLQARGYQVTSAEDGEVGFEKARQEKPDAILLDVMMKHVSEGLDIAVKLRDDPQTGGIPVILVTGIHKPEFLSSSFRPEEEWPNLKATLEKPIKPDQLMRALEKVLG
jgi:CheY-like chemotaxis protein